MSGKRQILSRAMTARMSGKMKGICVLRSVCVLPPSPSVGSKIGSQPKSNGPLAGTMSCSRHAYVIERGEREREREREERRETRDESSLCQLTAR